MILQKEISIPAVARGYHIITSIINREIHSWIASEKLHSHHKNGWLQIFIKHTSAGLTINENADPDVLVDFESFMNKIVPENEPFLVHTIEGPDDMPAHIKSSLVGSSVSVPITNGAMNLGTWQGIYLCEFRNRASSRKLVLTLYME